MSNLILNGSTNVCGVMVPNIEGGFGEGKKAMLTKDIAGIHGFETTKVNQDIKRNRSRFKDSVDIIDLKGSEFVITLSDNNILTKMEISKAEHIYLFSERGYSKLLKIFDDDLAWDKYDQIIDEYFTMKSDLPQTQAQLLVLYAQRFVDQEKILMEHDRKITEVKQSMVEVQAKVETVKEVFTIKDEDWREMIRAKIKKIADVTGDYQAAWRDAYTEIDRHGFRLGLRLTNRKKRMAEQGCSLTEIKKVTKLDIIEEDPKAKEIFTNIVSKMVLKHVI